MISRTDEKKSRDPRNKIVDDFSRWTAFSSLRSGIHEKSREAIYGLLKETKFEEIFSYASIDCKAFDKWHKKSVLKMKNLPVGWSAKLINVYLKTRVYIAEEGSKNLINCIHPPIDRGLLKGIRKAKGIDSKYLQEIKTVKRIKDIEDYDGDYMVIIGTFRKIMGDRPIIEIEEYWEPY